MKKNEELRQELSNRIKDKSRNLVIMDSKWQDLFLGMKKPRQIANLEQKLKDLMLKQSKLTEEVKILKTMKSSLMSEFVSAKSSFHDKEDATKRVKNDTYSERLNKIKEEITSKEDELFEIPGTITMLNNQIILEGLMFLQDILMDNTKKIDSINDWVKNVREELKNMLLLAYFYHDKNKEIYSYMHDILGIDIMNIFDDSNNDQNNEKNGGKDTQN